MLPIAVARLFRGGDFLMRGACEMGPYDCSLIAADHDRHGHETQNEHEDGDGGPK
jgi:hypothetical protein